MGRGHRRLGPWSDPAAFGYLRRMSLLTRGPAAVGGALLATGTKAIAAVRPAAKPLHPRGRLREACLYRHGLTPPLGVEWLDGVGIDEVLVRESRGIGLPDRMPDVHGLAVKVTGPDGSQGDLLLGSTGWGRLTRYLATASRTTYGRPMTTLLPYRTAAGPVLIGARAIGVETIELACAVGTGEWRHFADLRLSTTYVDDPDVYFDPVVNQLPGLDQYGWVERMREPAYAEARASR